MATTRKLGWFGSLIIGAIFIGAGYFIFHLSMDSYYMGQASEDWPTVQGSVIHSKVASSHDSKGTKYSVDVQYAYRLDGKEYTSNKIEAMLGRSASSDSSDAYGTVNQYPVGKNVTVHYNPDKPWIAVLQAGIAQNTYWILGISAVFMLIGAWIMLSSIARVLLGIGMLGVLTFAWLKRDK